MNVLIFNANDMSMMALKRFQNTRDKIRSMINKSITPSQDRLHLSHLISTRPIDMFIAVNQVFPYNMKIHCHIIINDFYNILIKIS